MKALAEEQDIALDYDRFMGRWSALVAEQFVDWLAIPAGRRWLDVGCGTGALTAAIVRRTAPLEVWGIDPQEAYVSRAGERFGGGNRHFTVADAQALPQQLQGLDVAVSGLVLNLLPEPATGLLEQVRVTRPGGVVAAYVWDFAAGMRLLRHLWDAARTFDPEADALDQGKRYPLCRPEPLRALFESVGLSAIDVQALHIATPFRGFTDYWESLANGHGNAPAYVRSLAPRQRERLRARLRKDLPTASDGSIPLTARAWAVRGTRI
jgi:SAM-dependent methyltransferase